MHCKPVPGVRTTVNSQTLTNSILWDNTAPNGRQIYNFSEGVPTVSYSLVEGGCSYGSTCDHILDADPQFVDANGLDDTVGTLDGNLRLQRTSPGIDGGDNTAVAPDVRHLDDDGDTTEKLLFDLDGHLGFLDIPQVPDTGLGPGPIVDMGAYEAKIKIYLPLVMKNYAA